MIENWKKNIYWNFYNILNENDSFKFTYKKDINLFNKMLEEKYIPMTYRGFALKLKERKN